MKCCAIAVALLLGACSSPASPDRAWEALPKGARDPVRRDVTNAGRMGGGGTTAHEVEADMTRAEFEAWCAALSLSLQPVVSEQRAGEPPEESVMATCERSRGRTYESITFHQAAKATSGSALYRAVD